MLSNLLQRSIRTLKHVPSDSSFCAFSRALIQTHLDKQESTPVVARPNQGSAEIHSTNARASNAEIFRRRSYEAGCGTGRQRAAPQEWTAAGGKSRRRWKCRYNLYGRLAVGDRSAGQCKHAGSVPRGAFLRVGEIYFDVSPIPCGPPA